MKIETRHITPICLTAITIVDLLTLDSGGVGFALWLMYGIYKFITQP